MLRAGICKRLGTLGIDSKESILQAYVACRAGMSNRVVVPAQNRFLGSLKGFQILTLRYIVWWKRFLGIDYWAP
jgi:hypothetical protein